MHAVPVACARARCRAARNVRNMPPRSRSGNPMTAANFDNQSLRGFLAMVEADFPEEILRIRETVDTKFDMTAVAYELERAGKSPVVIFEKPGHANGAGA